MSIVVLNSVSLTVANTNILQNVSWQIDNNERIALLGRNGAGKSTFLKLLAGELTPDSGVLQRVNAITVSSLSQDVAKITNNSVYANLVAGLGKTGDLLAQYYDATKNDELQKIADMQKQLDALHAWDLLPKIANIATQLDIDTNQNMDNLSGGMRRRVLLASAIIAEPQLLLLDEPTNHLDIKSIEWLGSYLNNYPSSVIFVTHDREFLQEIATKIIELDRGNIHTYTCSYEKYLERRESLLLSERRQNALFDKRLQLEEEWIRQGIKARRTRNEGRVRKLKVMREDFKNRRNELRKLTSINIDVTRSSKIVIEAQNVNYAVDNKQIISDFSLLLTKGDKVGIIGPNGCGKTTLIRLLLGELSPNSGTIKRADNLGISYFDQLRQQLDMNKNLMENVGNGSTHVTVNGKQKHVAAYLQDFLFNKDKLTVTPAQLSGGECNRLLLAKLFANPVNLMVLDEPTNDLDLETLELLESMLVEYSGTLLLITHDREFINQVVTSVLVYEDNHFVEYIGGYDDYKQNTKLIKPKIINPNPKVIIKNENKSKKLTYNEQRELTKMPELIEKKEAEIGDLQNMMLSVDFYAKDAVEITKINMQLQKLEEEVASLYLRWEELSKS